MTPEEMGQLVTAEEQRRGLPAGSLQNVFMRESAGGRTLQRGRSGEYGPMQVMPDTGRAYGYTPQQLADPATNIRAGADVFDHAYRRFHGDLSAATAAYNAGEGGASHYYRTHNIADLPGGAQVYMQRSMHGSPNLPWYHAAGQPAPAAVPAPQPVAAQQPFHYQDAPANDDRMAVVEAAMRRNYEESIRQAQQQQQAQQPQTSQQPQQPYNAPQQNQQPAMNTGARNGGESNSMAGPSGAAATAAWPGSVQPAGTRPTVQWPNFRPNADAINTANFDSPDWAHWIKESVTGPDAQPRTSLDDRDAGFI